MTPHSTPYEGRTWEEIQAIEQAKHNYKDFLERVGRESEGVPSPIGETWASMKARLFTPAEIAEAQKFVQRVGRKIKAREARERAALARQAQVGTRPAQHEQRAVAGA